MTDIKKEIGRNQFNFLLSHGLQPYMKFLDIGCGSFRTGQYLIYYLDEGNYYAIDKTNYSTHGIVKGNTGKKMTFKHTDKFEIFNCMFDFIFAWSLFTHLKPYQIVLCLSKVSEVMHSDSMFFASYFPQRGKISYGRVGKTNNFVYDLSWIEHIAYKYNISTKEVEVNHHNENQRMILFRKHED